MNQDDTQRRDGDHTPATADIANRGGTTAGIAGSTGGTVHLLSADKLAGYGERWTGVQAKFVDEPKQSVEQADGLVAEVIQDLAKRFAEERSNLEGQWARGGEASTEDLRQALQHYRSFFQRLLAA
jgi:hypothetical protein